MIVRMIQSSHVATKKSCRFPPKAPEPLGVDTNGCEFAIRFFKAADAVIVRWYGELVVVRSHTYAKHGCVCDIYEVQRSDPSREKPNALSMATSPRPSPGTRPGRHEHGVGSVRSLPWLNWRASELTQRPEQVIYQTCSRDKPEAMTMMSLSRGVTIQRGQACARRTDPDPPAKTPRFGDLGPQTV